MTFRITGLAPTLFQPLFALDDARLAERGVERCQVTEKPGAPCRITLADAEPGESVLLLSYTHQPASTPYHQAGPIFVRETAVAAFDAIAEIPPAMAIRTLSIRAYDKDGAMVDADLIDGGALRELIARFWRDARVAYAHAHYAKRGCFAAAIRRL